MEAGKLEEENAEGYVEAMAAIMFHTLKRNGFLCMDVEWDQLELDWLIENYRRKQAGTK